MEQTDVIIVGAGPSGLALALALNHYNVKSIILEQNLEICNDPRAIAIAGDAQRIIELLGVTQEKLHSIGQIMSGIKFHKNSFTTKPFHSIDYERDWLQQVFAPGTVILQPELEKEMRNLIEASENARLRLNSTVTHINEVEDGVQVTYLRKDGTAAELQGIFLVGADGKRGYVRKGYLEAKGITQSAGMYQYEGTWIAANLHITLPTPTSHPNFPLWKLGYSSQELWDIFWPEGFHFCTHATMPVATGRFGPKNDTYWRFEYELPPNFLPDDLEKHLEKQMEQHLTIPARQLSRKGMTVDGSVRFPWDCVKILRCGPANFSQKVVNRWYHNNIILIGDAAHVFPPFGAQGIVNGLRDAFALSWRLALLCKHTAHAQLSIQSQCLFEQWSQERRKGVDDASLLTSSTGDILLSKSFVFTSIVGIISSTLNLMPWLRDRLLYRTLSDKAGLRGKEGCYFLDGEGGGWKVAQVYVNTSEGSSSSCLSDNIFWRPKSTLSLLLLDRPDKEEALAIEQALADASLPPYFLSDDVLELCEDASSTGDSTSYLETKKLFPTTFEDAIRGGMSLLPYYDSSEFRRRFQATARFALMRSDLIVFSQGQTPAQLRTQLQLASEMLTAG